MFDDNQSFQLVTAGVVALVCVASCIAWSPATRRDPGGLPSRLFLGTGLVAVILDAGGLGSVLGLALAAMGAFVAWEGQPAPEVPRPRRIGLVTAAVLTGLATLAVLRGWGVFGRIPEEVRAVIAMVVAGTGALITLAAADRARTTLRDAIRRRFFPDSPRS